MCTLQFQALPAGRRCATAGAAAAAASGWVGRDAGGTGAGRKSGMRLAAGHLLSPIPYSYTCSRYVLFALLSAPVIAHTDYETALGLPGAPCASQGNSQARRCKGRPLWARSLPPGKGRVGWHSRRALPAPTPSSPTILPASSRETAPQAPSRWLLSSGKVRVRSILIFVPSSRLSLQTLSAEEEQKQPRGASTREHNQTPRWQQPHTITRLRRRRAPAANPGPILFLLQPWVHSSRPAPPNRIPLRSQSRAPTLTRPPKRPPCRHGPICGQPVTAGVPALLATTQAATVTQIRGRETTHAGRGGGGGTYFLHLFPNHHSFIIPPYAPFTTSTTDNRKHNQTRSKTESSNASAHAASPPSHRFVRSAGRRRRERRAVVGSGPAETLPRPSFPHRASHRCTVARARAAYGGVAPHTVRRGSRRVAVGDTVEGVSPLRLLFPTPPPPPPLTYTAPSASTERQGPKWWRPSCSPPPRKRRVPQPRTDVPYLGPPRVHARTVEGDVGGGAAAAAVATGRGVDGQTGERIWPWTRPGGAAPPLGMDCMASPRRPSSVGGGGLGATGRPHVSRPVSMTGGKSVSVR